MNSKNKILVGCLALLLVLSVGYALFSDTITINGTATAKGDFDITTTCQAGIPSQFGTTESLGLEAEGGYNSDSCSVVDDTVSINVGFEYPSARRYFTIQMTNAGTIDATLNIFDMQDKVSGELCIANNKEGTNATCEEYLQIGSDGNQADKVTAGWFSEGLLLPAAFIDEQGSLVPNEGTTTDFFDATNYIITLKPNQTAIFLVDAYLSQYYTLSHFGDTGEFYASRTLTLEYPWQQKTTN